MKKADFDISLENAVGIQLLTKKGDRVQFPPWNPLELDSEYKVRKMFSAYTPDFIEEIIDDNVSVCRENFEKQFPNTEYAVFVFRIKDGKVGMGALPTSSYDSDTDLLIQYPVPLSSLLQQG